MQCAAFMQIKHARGGERGNYGASAVLLLYVAWALTYATTTPLCVKLPAHAFDRDDSTKTSEVYSDK